MATCNYDDLNQRCNFSNTAKIKNLCDLLVDSDTDAAILFLGLIDSILNSISYTKRFNIVSYATNKKRISDLETIQKLTEQLIEKLGSVSGMGKKKPDRISCAADDPASKISLQKEIYLRGFYDIQQGFRRAKINRSKKKNNLQHGGTPEPEDQSYNLNMVTLTPQELKYVPKLIKHLTFLDEACSEAKSFIGPPLKGKGKPFEQQLKTIEDNVIRYYFVAYKHLPEKKHLANMLKIIYNGLFSTKNFDERAEDALNAFAVKLKLQEV